ncbi:MAG: sugar phosphate nucleotidyltransferase [Bacteroidia bacterium]|nr:sugar phosphate nucleotidyltransferase [Bacteroidia bacterium]
MDREAIVLAGGLGTRLRSVLPDLPKVLAPIQGVPFLGYLLRYLKREGIGRVILSLGYKAEEVMKALSHEKWDIEIIPVIEPEPLGTGGALAYAWGKTTQKRVFALNGDTFFPIDLRAFEDFHERQGAPLSIALAHVAPADRYGLVEVRDGWVYAFREKAPAAEGWIYGGIALIETAWWKAQSWSFSFSWESYLMKAVPALPVAAYQAEHVPFIDIGVPADYERAQTLIPAYARF